VIDWPDACRGDPAADVCRSYLLLKLHAEEIAEPYLEAYCRINNAPASSHSTNKVTRRAILDWLPYVAAARLAENVPDDFDRLLKIVYPWHSDLNGEGGHHGPSGGQGCHRNRWRIGNRCCMCRDVGA
jgi:hypothetical protein